MAITNEEYKKETKILKLISNLLNKNLEDLEKEVKVKEEDLVDFKKMMWQDSSSFDVTIQSTPKP